MTPRSARVEELESVRIADLALRGFRDERDYQLLAELITAANLADGIDYIPDAANLRVEYENSEGFDPHRDLVIAESGGVGVGYVDMRREVRDDVPIYFSFGSVLPEFRRRGLGRALLGVAQRRLREIGEHYPDDGDRQFGAWAIDREGGARELLEGDGYVAVRYGFEMQRRGLDDLPDAPLPDGLEIRPVDDARLRTVFDAENEAFRDHWGHRDMGDFLFRELAASPDLDTSLWRVAWDGDEVAGVVETFIFRSENARLGVDRGWLERISVRRPWRRRGLARALIVSALAGLRDAGMTDAMLGVDAENPTGALQLYESLGFAVQRRSTTYRKPW